MIIEGKKLAAEVLARAKARAKGLGRRPLVVAYAPAPTAATNSYLKIKERSAAVAGCTFETRETPDFTDADAAIIQLPLPTGMDAKILETIPLEKDADVLSRAAREAGTLLPPVVGAIKEIFDTYQVEPRGKRAVVIGKGFLVGAPASKWLREEGAEVVVADSKTKDLAGLLKTADIIISGVGIPGLVKPEMLKDGVILVDAGTSELSGKVVGDADPACADKCSLFTPVPGGIGPLAVAKLFENAVVLAERLK